MPFHQRILVSGWVFLAAIVLPWGCSRPASSPQEVAESDTPAEVDTESLTPKELALRAKDDLFQRLSAELMAAMSDGGPGAAIEVCSQKAPQIAAEVGKEHGLRIGRTSFKLRNPENQPPAWAQDFVAERVAEPQFVELEDQATGALLPIRLKAQCLTCHGPENELAQNVREQLASRYPEDRATGFKDGDLRGWFWVEVPAKPSTL